jgi:hypothetical protein
MGVLRRLGGTTPAWRTDRLATVIVPGTGDVQASFAPVARHYGAIIRPCPPRRGNRKGSVEAAVRYACGRWWRTMPARTMAEAQASLDRFCETIGDVRRRADSNVRALAQAEPLLALPPPPYPATIGQTGPVDANATVAFRRARYSVPPGLIGAALTIRQRLGSTTLESSTHSKPLEGGRAGSRSAPLSVGAPSISIRCSVGRRSYVRNLRHPRAVTVACQRSLCQASRATRRSA